MVASGVANKIRYLSVTNSYNPLSLKTAILAASSWFVCLVVRVLLTFILIVASGSSVVLSYFRNIVYRKFYFDIQNKVSSGWSLYQNPSIRKNQISFIIISHFLSPEINRLLRINGIHKNKINNYLYTFNSYKTFDTKVSDENRFMEVCIYLKSFFSFSFSRFYWTWLQRFSINLVITNSLPTWVLKQPGIAEGSQWTLIVGIARKWLVIARLLQVLVLKVQGIESISAVSNLKQKS